MKLGYDLYVVTCDDIIGLLKRLKDSKVTLYQLNKIDEDTYSFYLPIYQRRIVKQYQFTYIKSIGVIAYLLLLFRNKISLIGCISFIVMIIISGNFIWDVRIVGSNPDTNKKVNEVLNELNIDKGDKIRSYKELNEIYDRLKDKFKQNIDYLNIYQSGSVLVIEYTNSKSAIKEELDFRNIYARKDAIIKNIDVSSGNIKVKEYQYVKKGELLVENTIISTNDETKIIPTKGTIYGYTYQTYEASIDNIKMDKGEAFSFLLFKIRMKLQAIDKIDRERVIEYGIIDNKIVLKVQYILIEDIGTKEN